MAELLGKSEIETVRQGIRLLTAELLGTHLPYHLEIEFGKLPPSAGTVTDGKRIVLPIEKKEQAYYIHSMAHEMVHILLEHVRRGKELLGEEPKPHEWWLWNLACDDAVTRMLKKVYGKLGGGVMPALSSMKGKLYEQLSQDVDLSKIPDYPEGAPVEAVYRWLSKQKVEIKAVPLPWPDAGQQGQQQGQGGGQDDQRSGSDYSNEHTGQQRQDSGQDSSQGNDQDNTTGGSGQQSQNDTQNSAAGPQLVTATVKAGDKEYTFTYVTIPSNAEGQHAKPQAGERYRVTTHLKARGLDPGNALGQEWQMAEIGGINRFIRALEQYLTSFANQHGDDLSFLKPNKKFMALGVPVLLPTRVQKQVKAMVAIDTSGSISDRELNKFLTVLYRAAKFLNVDVLFVDAKVQEVVNLRNLSEEDFRRKLKKLKPGGRGGTDYKPAFDYYFKHRNDYDLVIYFTDLFCDFPKHHPPRMVWVAEANEQTMTAEKPPYGKLLWI